ncbi:MAG TPA: hypothetical protein VGR07_07100 [Thermoanaerobaculia bacterium]|jgi:hypothetical protein|nr:hypothetical protein [Thermoanaerobaculia bacterium]
MKISISRMATLALVLLALSAVAPLAAETLPASNDGWTTPGGGQTIVDLSQFPVARVLGSAPVSNTVSMKGQPLDSTNLGSIDTLLERGTTTLTSNTGTGTLQLVAISLTSESNVRLTDGRAYRLDFVRSPTPAKVGTITITRTNADGGTFSSSFDVLPKLTFTNVNPPFDVVNIDCAGGGCGTFTMTSSSTGWVNAGGFNPSTRGVTPINSGITVQGYKTIGRPASGAMYPGYSPSAPNYAASSVNEQELLNRHQGSAAEDCKTTKTGALSAKAIAINKFCDVVATPN